VIRRLPWLPLIVVLLGAASVALVLGAEHLHAAAIIGWAVLVTITAVALWRHEIRRAEAERALRESEARLYQAQKMEAVGRLAGGIAHDINNYLAGIRTHCELLATACRRGDLDPDRAVARLDAMVETVLKASSLVERLLTFGRRQVGMPERVDLGDVVAGFVRGLGGGLGEGVTLKTRITSDVWPVMVDLSQIEQVLANLVVNARDALEQGRGRIEIVVENVPGSVAGPATGPNAESNADWNTGADRVRLSVTDTGRGIPPEIRDQIFDPFFSTKGTVGASGLGLATVYAVVKEAGGTIEVESHVAGPGESGRSGTTFRVLLPRAAPGIARRAAPRGASSAPGPAERQGSGGERILLVDDEEPVREATRELLDSLGYRVDAVASATAAEKAVHAARADGDPFALVITDVRLGEVSGPDLVARLREDAPLPAVFMSGYTDRIALRPDFDRGASGGEAFFLKKPFSGEGLVRMVRELLDAP